MPAFAEAPQPPTANPAATGSGGVMTMVTSGGVTTVTFYTPAPGTTERDLYDKLAARGTRGLQSLESTFGRNTCSMGTATTLLCPQVYWSSPNPTAGTNPDLYFVDHSSSAWPVSAMVPTWNKVVGINSRYATSCPSGAHCVQVYSSNYGATGWTGQFTANYNATSRQFLDGSAQIQLNNNYNSGDATRRKDSVCHEMGHAIGLGHNASSGSCMYASNGTPVTPDSDDYALAADIYSAFP